MASSRAAFGVRFDPVGERMSLVDERGSIIEDDRALLVMLDLVAAERRSGRVALPVTTTRIAEQVAAYHGTQVDWTTTSPDDLTRRRGRVGRDLRRRRPRRLHRPRVQQRLRRPAAFVRLIGLVARTQLTLSQIDARIPQAHVARAVLPTPWAVKGLVMRRVVEAAGDRSVDTTDGVRVVEADGRWVMVLPDPAEAVTHLWAEAARRRSAQALLDRVGRGAVAARGRLMTSRPGRARPRSPRAAAGTRAGHSEAAVADVRRCAACRSSPPIGAHPRRDAPTRPCRCSPT